MSSPPCARPSCATDAQRALERADALARARAVAASAKRPASIRDAAAPETRSYRRRAFRSSRTPASPRKSIVPSAICRWPEIIAAPPIRQLRPMRVDPAMPTQPAIAVCAPMTQLCPIWIWLSSLTSSSMTVSSMRAAVDRRVGADLDVVADDHAADLRDLAPASALVRDAEAVGADDRAAVDERARADDAVRVDGDARDRARRRRRSTRRRR